MTGCYWTHGMGWREEAEVEGEWQRKPPDCDILTTAECHTAVISDTSMVPWKKEKGRKKEKYKYIIFHIARH